jgi:hypothetical protein
MINALATQLFSTDLVDPTPDGILTRVVNFAIAGLMVLVALLGAWKAFQAWVGPAGAKDAATKAPPATGGSSGELKKMREVVFGVIAVEALLGGILVLANYGTSILPSLGIV